MAEPLLRVERVSRRFGGLLAVNDVSLTAPPGPMRSNTVAASAEPN